MQAIISDVHSNLEALTVVLNDIRVKGIDDIVCLGDIVGYGPDPESCIDLVKENCGVCIMGNHDDAVIHGAVDFNRVAEEAVYCTQGVLLPNSSDSPEKHERWNFLKNLPLKHEVDDITYVHGSPRNPIVEYLTEDDVIFIPSNQIVEAFGMIKRLCFIGHSHCPGIIDSDFKFWYPTDDDPSYELGEGKLLINAGAVGQPRDMDKRACYLTMTESDVTYHRLEYDYETTMKKIRDIDGLDDILAERLEVGM